jgi:hypothetical protein
LNAAPVTPSCQASLSGFDVDKAAGGGNRLGALGFDRGRLLRLGAFGLLADRLGCFSFFDRFDTGGAFSFGGGARSFSSRSHALQRLRVKKLSDLCGVSDRNRADSA